MKVSRRLGRSSDRLLLWQDVQLVQMGLDRAVRDLLALLQCQYLTHGRIRMNGVTLLRVLQLVLLHIGGEGTSDIGGGHLSALGLAQERTQLVLQRHGSGKDSGALLLGLAILLLLDTTATTTRLLNLLGDALLELLEVLNRSHGLITQLLLNLNQFIDLMLHGRQLSDLRSRLRRRGDRGFRNGRLSRSDGRGGRGLAALGGLDRSLLWRSSDWSSDGWGNNRGNGSSSSDLLTRRRIGLLRDTLGSGRGSGSGGRRGSSGDSSGGG